MNKVRKGMEFKGPAYVQILCPCVPGWGFPSQKTIEVGKLANETGSYPLYEIENGVLKLSLVGSKKPVEQYIKMQSRFKHITKEEIKDIQKNIDEEYKYLLSVNNKKIFL